MANLCNHLAIDLRGEVFTLVYILMALYLGNILSGQFYDGMVQAVGEGHEGVAVVVVVHDKLAAPQDGGDDHHQ